MSVTITLTSGGKGYTSAPDVSVEWSGGDETGSDVGTAIIGNPTVAHLVWTDPVDADLVQINVYRGTTTTDTDSKKVAEVRAGVEQASVPLTVAVGVDQYFWLKAVDEAGNASVFSAMVTVTRT